MDAIAGIKARGLKVTLYPFVMMDIEADNELPDPLRQFGPAGLSSAAGITCDPGAADSRRRRDRTAAVRATRSRIFCGNALPGQFSASANTINFRVSSGEEFRRFVRTSEAGARRRGRRRLPGRLRSCAG